MLLAAAWRRLLVAGVAVAVLWAAVLWVAPTTPATAPAQPPVRVATQPTAAAVPESGALRAVVRSGLAAPGGGRFDRFDVTAQPIDAPVVTGGPAGYFSTLPIKAMRQQISSAVDLLIQANRLQGGPRKLTSLTEVMNMEQDVIIMQEIFRYKQMGLDQNGRAHGQFEATGVRPAFVSRLEAAGIKLPSNLFQERVLLRD